MNSYFVTENLDGTIAITTITPKALGEGITCELEFERLRKQGVLDSGQKMIGVGLPLPKQNQFRNAWVIKNKSVRVCPNKAIEITKHRLREERLPLLVALDIEYQRADENGDTQAKKEIAKKKNVLRDITANLPKVALNADFASDEFLNTLNSIKANV